MKHKIGLIFLAGCFIAALSFAQETPATDVGAKMDEMLTKLFDNHLFAGSVLVAQNGHVLLSKGYGLADRQQNIPNTPQTGFRIGAITKQFTSMGIMILQNQGKLDVTDLACQYLPECPAGWQTFTIHQLLTHDPVSNSSDASNVAYSELGEIIANVSGQSYENALWTMIFDPLKMQHTTFIPHQANEAIGYDYYSATNNEPALYEDLTDIQAAAGLYSTAEDLYLWDQALYTEQLIPKESTEVALTPHIKVDNDDNDWAHGYGYGWWIGQQGTHEVVAYEANVGDSFRSGIFRFPQDKVTVIVLSNQGNIAEGYVASLLTRIVFGEL